MRKYFISIVFTMFAIVAFTACGTTSVATQKQMVSKPTPTPTPVSKTASQIVEALKQAGLPIGITFVYNESNDLNHLLGRPGQYTSKAEFKDTRIASTDKGADIAVGDGGSVEVCASATDTQHRFAYVQGIAKSVSLLSEYDYMSGNAILRVSSQLTPSQAKVYQVAFEKAMKS